MHSSDPRPTVQAPDEIDLVEVMRGLWAERILIVVVAVVVTAVAAAYAFLATPEYRVQSVLRPASVQHLDLLNATGVISLGRDEALRRIGAGLESYDHRLAYFRTNVDRFEALREEGRTVEQAVDEFHRERLRMLLPDPKREEGLSAFVGVEMTYPRGVDGVNLLNGFVDFVIDLERERLLAELNALIANRLSQLDGKIAAGLSGYESTKASRIARLLEADRVRRAELEDELRTTRDLLKKTRLNRIQQLDEAIKIATSLGIRKPSTPGFLAGAERPPTAGEIRLEVNSQQIPLYFLGTEALAAEREVLQNRRGDDFTEPRIAQLEKELQLLASNRQVEALRTRADEQLFLEELAGWRQEAARLGAIKIDPEHLHLVHIDQRAVEPIKPVKPRRALIVALGLVLGGMAGLMAALVKRAFRGSATAQGAAA